MIDLDDLKVYSRLDPQGIRERIRELPQQCLQAWQQAQDFVLPSNYADVSQVVVLGMGGSAIGGDLLSSLTLAESRVLITVCRNYDLPSYVDANTLVIASSYSGMTEETISSFNQAMKTPARKMVLTTGGRIREIAEENNLPVFSIKYNSPPRAALAHSLFPLLSICQNLGLIANKASDVTETIDVLETLKITLNEDSPFNDNPAKQLARKLQGKLTVIYGAGIMSTVAQRWKGQINENAKSWAFFETFPELNHNAVVGYEFPRELAQSTFVVLLRSKLLHHRVLTRYQVTSEVVSQAGVANEMVDGMGESALSQMMSLILFGDWVSYYLAILNEADPFPVKVIDYLKKRLANS